MHWYAMRRSAAVCRSRTRNERAREGRSQNQAISGDQSAQHTDRTPSSHGNRGSESAEDDGLGEEEDIERQRPSNTAGREYALRSDNTPSALGNDDAADSRVHRPLQIIQPMSTIAFSTAAEHDDLEKTSGYCWQVPIPSRSSGLTTWAYQEALRNRALNYELALYAKYDIIAYTPTFIHDCLMLPGSLANVLGGKLTVPEYTDKMTSAILPGYRALVHPETYGPCLLKSPYSRDHVRGMLVLGLGRSSRALLEEHYRANHTRIKAYVEIDVADETPFHQRGAPGGLLCLKRITIKAHVFLWSKATNVDIDGRSVDLAWTLEDYIEGKLSGREHEALHVGPQEGDHAGKELETVYGSPGHLDYERTEVFTGW